MGIGGITSTNSVSTMQITAADLKDQKSKSLQKEITDIQQQMQKVSSDDELTASEKENERKELKREKSSLDTELKQHQEALVRSHKREIKLAELQEEQNPAKEEDAADTAAQVQTSEVSSGETDKMRLSADGNQPLQPGTVISESSDGKVILKEIMNPAQNNTAAVETKPTEETKATAAAAEEMKPAEEEKNTDPAAEFRPTANEMQAMVSADTSAQIAGRMGTLVAKTNDGIAILKGEMKQDAARGVDTERKQAELKEMQEQRKREMAAQFSMLGAAGNAMEAALNTEPINNAAQNDAGKDFQVSGLHVPQDEQAAQQGFQVAIA